MEATTTVRYIGLGSLFVAALALIVAALLRQPEPLPPAVARGDRRKRQADEVTRHPGLTLVRDELEEVA